MSKNTGTSELINYFTLGASGAVDIGGNLTLSTIANATTDTDKFLVSDTGIIKYRTGTQLLSDIGAQAAGNYVTTDTSQAITANKSFTVGFSLGSEGSGNQTSFFRNTSSIFSGSGGSNIFGFNNSNNIYFGKGLNNGGVLQWNNTTATRYYTLPDADGTLALTSQIPANPVGGTGTLNTIPKFTAASTIGNSNIFDSGSIIYNTNPAAGQFAWQFGGSTVTGQSYGAQVIAGTNASDIGFRVMNAAASINYLVVRGDGLVTLTGALNGTSAVFSSSVTANNTITLIGPNATNNTENAASILFDANSNLMGKIVGFRGVNGNDGNLRFYTSNSSTLSLTLASTGAATFSGDVAVSKTGTYSQIQLIDNTASGSTWITLSGFPALGDYTIREAGVANHLVIKKTTGAATFSSSVTAAGTNYLINTSTGSAATYQRILNTGGDAIIGLNSSAGTSLAAGGLAYATAIYNNTNTALQFGTNAAFNMTIAAGGNVGIGTTSPSDRLVVNGNLGVTDGTFAAGESYSLYLGDKNAFVNSTFGQRVRFGAYNGFDFGFAQNNDLTLSSTWMTITSSGNVGIGTTSPGGFLEVSSPNSGNTQMLLVRNYATSATGNFTGNYTAEVRGASSGTIQHAMLIHSNENNTTRRILDITSLAGTVASFLSNGNVLIGTPTDAGYKLDVAGTGRFSTAYNGGGIGMLHLTSNGTEGGTITFEKTSGTAQKYKFGLATSSLFIYNETAGNQPFTLTSGGNVGIGTSSPNANFILDINSTKASGASGMRLTTQSTSAGPIFVFNYTGSTLTNWAIGAHQSTAGCLEFVSSNSAGGDPSTSGTSRMLITSAGNVGINVTPGGGNRFLVKGEGTTSGFNSLLLRDSADVDIFTVRCDKAVFAPGVYNFTAGSAANVVVFSDGSLQRSTSSIKYKKNVENYSKGLEEVMLLRPVTYEGISKSDKGKTFAGLIAEEVHDLGLNEFVQYAEDGSPDALSYSNMISLLIKAIQEQQIQINQLKNQIK